MTTHSTNENDTKSKNTYIIKELEDEDPLNAKLKTSFDDAADYLTIQPNMIIGK